MHRLLALLLLVSASSLAQQPIVPLPDFDQVTLDFDNEIRAHSAKLMATSNEAERQQLSGQFPSPEKIAPTILRIMQEHTDEATQIKAMNWLVSRAQSSPAGEAGRKALMEKYADKKGIVLAIDSLSYSTPQMAESLLRTIREKNKNVEEQCGATHALAKILFTKGEGGDKAAWEEASKLFTEVVTLHKDVKVNGFLLSESAMATLFEMENLQVGKKAPDIEGKDVTGTHFKLSDYKGKVVVVMFWGSWCHACHGTFDIIKPAIAAAGDKAVLLGVNTDPLAKIQEITKTENISWRNWCDEFNRGPISALWNIRHWPTLWVIDQQGVIQGRDVAPGFLAAKLAELTK